MDCLVGCASSIVANFVDSTIGVVARRLFPYRRDVANLTAGIRDLSKARETVEEEVKNARDEGLVIHDDVEEWLSSAGVISETAQAFRDSSRDRANISCCTLRIPNLLSRRRLSREARQLLEELERKIGAGSFVSVASRPAMHRGIEISDYEHFESRKAILKDIMTALRDRDVTKVGVHGMGGIGKTKLAQEVARRATEANLFTEVVVTTISQKPDIGRLQQEIAGKMKIKFEGSVGESERAEMLLCRLREEKKILIILDDIWERLDLLKVGIHFEHEGCKILMTSRYLGALDSMLADRTFEVKDLSAEEAMRLFKTIVKGDVIVQRGIATLVNDVVRKCGRLPLAITTVAYALRCQKDPSVWSNALMQLRNSAPTDIDRMLVDVYQSIKLSYDFLNSTEAKSLFLLCSLQGEDRDISVEDLMMISVGQGLFQNVHKLPDARNRVKSLVGKLKDHCLLLDGNDSGTVKMHDVIRDVALYIASESGQDMHCIYADKVEECLNNRKLRNAKVVSLVRYKFETHQLPEGLGCSHLESLFLVSSYFFGGHLAIPKHFLEGKDQLKSLLFNRANLVALSPPIHSLQNLQTLCLRGCVLEDVSFIGDLKSLIILDLSYSSIKQLPIEVGQLNRLQLLNLEGCEDLELIEPNIISSLIRLEELRIPDTFDKWEVGEITFSRRSNANLAELMNLPQLTSLSLVVPHSNTFPKHFMFSEELQQYRICIGDSIVFELFGIARSLWLTLEERSRLKELGLESMVKRSEALSLDGLAGVKNVVCDLDNEGFSDLKHLRFIRNVSVQYIVNCTVDQQIHLRKAFPMLESLCLEELTNLERICQGKLPQDSFNKLREVYVTNCDKLKNLFPLSIAKRLKKIEVRDCDMMEEVVGHGRENDAHIISDEATHHVVELRWLTLESLPKFVQFINWSESEATCGSPSVQSPIPLFCEKLDFPSLVALYLFGINVQILWLDFQFRTTSYMDNLTFLDVTACSNLKYLFPFFIAERLVKLDMLYVRDCEVMEDIVVMKNLEEEGRLGKILFPKLKDLTLEKLPALRNFCVGDCIKFESLSTLTIKHCPQLKTFLTCSTPILEVSVDNEEGNHSAITQPLFNEKLEFPSLEDLTLSEISVQILWLDSQFRTTSYIDKLTRLNVSTCNNLKYLFPFFIAERLVKLEKLDVSDCEVMEDIVVMKNLEEEGRLGKIFFPNLKNLTLEKLPALRNFCVGDCIKFESLSTLTIEHCPQLETFFSCSTPILEVSVDNEEEGRSGKISFPKLRDLWLYNLPALRNFCVGDCIKFESLSTLTIEHCPQLETFFSCSTPILEVSVDNEEEGRSGKISFPKLRDLWLYNLPALRNFCVGDCIKFESLSTLTIEHCPQLETFFSCSTPILEVSVDNEEEGRSGKILFPELRDLTLENLPALRNFCVGDCIKFESLSTLTIEHCPQLETFFSCSTPILEVSVDNEEEGRSGKILFPKLRDLTLENLPALRNFCVGDCIKFESLSYISIRQCPQLETFLTCSTPILEVSVDNEEGNHSAITQPLFNEKLEFPSLKTLILSEINVQILWLDFQPRTTSYMDNLTGLYVSACNNLKYLFPFFIAERLVKLESLDVSCCEVMEDIVVMKNLEEEGRLGKILFPNLKYLWLYNLPALRNFCVGDCIKFESLSTLTIEHCPQLETFFSCSTPILEVSVDNEEEGRSGKILFPKLEDLWLYNLPALRNFCVGDCIKFESLSRLTIQGCPQLKTFLTCSTPILEVSVDNEEEGRSGKILFPKLEDLWLYNLPALRNFCVGDCIKFESLSTLTIEHCPQLETFFSCSTPILEVSVDNEEEGRSGKILFPKLEDLWLYNLPALRNFCVGDCIKFESLSRLTIQGCPQLKTFLTCSTPILEVSVDNEEGNHSAITQPLFNEKLEFPSLKTLILSEINVQILWLDFQPRTTSYMDNLTGLYVSACNNLKYLFPFFIAERLVKLESLDVSCCEVMEDIVVMKNLEEEGRLGKILFPNLRDLTLAKLPALRNFCVGDCIKFESLSNIIIQGCPQLKTFFTCSTPILEVSVDNEEGNHSAITQPFFNEKVLLPVLEYLETDWSNAMNEQLNMSQSSSTALVLLLSNQLKELKLNCSTRDKPIALPIFDLLRRCQNLEKLTLKGFFVISAQEYDGQPVANLKRLKLANVPKLRYLFGESENAQPTNWFACFQNLTILEVSFCHRLTYLLASTIATSLVQLKKMRITDCNRMTTIIEDYRENETTKREHDHEFVFLKLKILELRNLPHLESFYSGNTDIRLPKLESLFVSRCPEMRTFSRGNISAPMLHKIIYGWRSQYLDGDVNTTVRKLWEDDSNLTLQQFTETEVHDSREGTSSRAADYGLLLQPYFKTDGVKSSDYDDDDDDVSSLDEV